MADLINLATCKALLQITETTWDTFLTTHLTTVSAWVRNECRRQFTKANYTEIKSGPAQRTCLWVAETPLLSVASLHDSLDRTYGDADLIDPENYVFWENGKIELVIGSFATGVKNLKVIYQGGYQTIPDMLAKAVAWKCGYLLERSGPDAGFESELIGDYQYKRAGKENLVLREIGNWLAAYKRLDRL